MTLYFWTELIENLSFTSLHSPVFWLPLQTRCWSELHAIIVAAAAFGGIAEENRDHQQSK